MPRILVWPMEGWGSRGAMLCRSYHITWVLWVHTFNFNLPGSDQREWVGRQ